VNISFAAGRESGENNNEDMILEENKGDGLEARLFLTPT